MSRTRPLRLHCYNVCDSHSFVCYCLLCVPEAERLRREVVTEIRSNQSLEEDLNTMDIKIGLLVKNRITLQVQWAVELLIHIAP